MRQGDPLSPYLFIIVADVLRAQIHHAFQQGLLAHPLIDDTPPPILQYADDTLFLLRGDWSNLMNLKRVLADYASATGLVINFLKSTFVPMHIKDGEAATMAQELGYTMSSFPQPYLGLALLAMKLHNSDFIPLISKCDKYLDGWKGHRLSTGGRLVLVNTVLSSMPIYHMRSLPLPKGIIAAIDRHCRSFLWTGEDICSGAKCLMAWEKACQPKCEDGLGIKNIALQNKCLLLKFAHKFFQRENSPWVRWLNTYGSTREHMVVNNTFLHQLITEHTQVYRPLSWVHVRNGHSTSFWFDDWLPTDPLCLAFPALFSHKI